MALELPKGATTVPPLPGGAISFDGLDEKTGAPNRLRAVINAYRKPEDKIKVLQQYYPDAIPFGPDNYVFKNPNTGQPTLFNPKGFDVGDVVEYGRVATEILASIPGFAAGGLVSSPTVVGIPVAGAAGAAVTSTAAGNLYDAALRKMFGSGVDDTRTAGEFASEIATQATIEAVTPFPAQKVLSGTRNIASKALNTETAKNTIEAAKNLDIKNLPLGVIAKGVAPTENALASTLGGGKIVKAYDDAIKRLSDSVDEITSMSGTKSASEVGSTVSDAAFRFEDEFITQSQKLYDDLLGLIPSNQVFDLPSLEKALRANKKIFDNNKINQVFGDSFTKKISKIFDKGYAQPGGGPVELTYNDIKQLRTLVGKQMKGVYVVGTSPDAAAMKQIYGALSDDMFKAAKDVGGEAFDTAKYADTYYKQGINILNKKIRPLTTTAGGKEQLADERVYDKVVTGTRTEPSKMNETLKDFMTADEIATVGEKQFYDLTRDAAGDFSVGKTVSNLNRYKQRTGEYPVTIGSLGPKVDDIDLLSRGFKEASKSYNFSNTARGNAARELGAALGLGAGGGLISGDPTVGLSIAAGSYLLPKTVATMLSNPATKSAFTNWATKAGTPVSEKIAVLVSMGVSAPQAEKLIEGSYREQSVQPGLLGN
tara:strand:+ start:915 stop:2873 length:1959 start_codon:yes stop_codon:yes gene_type:complete